MTCSSSDYGTHRCVRCDNEVEDSAAVGAELAETKAKLGAAIIQAEYKDRTIEQLTKEVEVWKREHAKAHGDWIETRKMARANMDAHSEALIEIEKLKQALANEREWSRALGDDSRAQQNMLDRVCDVIGFKGRNDLTDVPALVKAKLKKLRLEAEDLKKELADEKRFAKGWFVKYQSMQDSNRMNEFFRAQTLAKNEKLREVLRECLSALDWDNGERPEHGCQARARAILDGKESPS